ncbi:ATP-binding cassette domain-containing protein [Actinomadura logoneensis]|uniref:ATP-binding cassette domain-containing protein n=1 Tax=Actinomadura logoneensis TaxID=2293572 RepID=A0A372JD24_9ACTN|nr:ATP-binding cassette domain-containing protein [Actinomadura logoneensis]RFU37819.1 ATP-binding cassette domain-containing protein [Actinomadura logoneensis]
MTTDPCAVRAHDLGKTYSVRGVKGGVRALDGLDVTVDRGIVFGLLGPNGAGKSTAVKILTTLTRPDRGAAEIEGVDVLRRPDRVRRLIGVVAQRSGSDPRATTRENLVLQARMHGMSGPAARARTTELLDRFDLSEVADRLVRTLSGGTQRRLDVALGLVHRPAVLFLDEPTTGLDPEARTAMWAEIRRLAGRDGLTVVLTTHYLEEADRLAHRLAIVDRGRVVAGGTPDELKGELRGDAVHLDLPAGTVPAEVRAVLEALPAVREVRVAGGGVSARSDNGPAAVPTVLAALERAGMPAAAVTVARPSLDDVFLRYTGRRYTPGDLPGTPGSPGTPPAATSPVPASGAAAGEGPADQSTPSASREAAR